MSTLRACLRDNGLSITFAGLFVVCLALQSASGLVAYNDTLRHHGGAPIGYADYPTTGDFLSGVFANWQAAVLQLGCLIVFGKSLYQRGASHSRKPERAEGCHDAADGRAPWVYRNSLGLAFGILFAASFAAHVFSGWAAYNHTRSLADEAPIGVGAYLLTGSFWFKTTQAWQAEFFAIAGFLVLSVFLRQQGSPESKPVGSPDAQTGGGQRLARLLVSVSAPDPNSWCLPARRPRRSPRSRGGRPNFKATRRGAVHRFTTLSP